MGRKKTGGELLPWLSEKPNNKEGRFTQVGNSLLLSKSYQKLNNATKHLYQSMCMESGGKREFVFPLKAAAKYGIAERTFRRSVQELQETGFIDTVSSGRITREANQYSFSLRWKQTEKPN